MMLHNKERIHSCIKKKKTKFYLQTMKVSHIMEGERVVRMRISKGIEADRRTRRQVDNKTGETRQDDKRTGGQ